MKNKFMTSSIILYCQISGAPGLHVKTTNFCDESSIFYMSLHYYFLWFALYDALWGSHLRWLKVIDTWMTAATWIHLRLRINLLDQKKSPRSNHGVILVWEKIHQPVRLGPTVVSRQVTAHAVWLDETILSILLSYTLLCNLHVGYNIFCRYGMVP